MKRIVNFSFFINEFSRFEGRYEQMGGYEGLRALFNFLEQTEEDTGTEIELDVIGLCCDFTQYDSFEDLQKDYEVEDIDELRDLTQVIEYDNGKLIIQAY